MEITWAFSIILFKTGIYHSWSLSFRWSLFPSTLDAIYKILFAVDYDWLKIWVASPSPSKIRLCFSPSALLIKDYFSPSDQRIFDHLIHSLSAYNSIAYLISSGGWRSLISYLITSTPHLELASFNWVLIFAFKKSLSLKIQSSSIRPISDLIEVYANKFIALKGF